MPSSINRPLNNAAIFASDNNDKFADSAYEFLSTYRVDCHRKSLSDFDEFIKNPIGMNEDAYVINKSSLRTRYEPCQIEQLLKQSVRLDKCPIVDNNSVQKLKTLFDGECDNIDLIFYAWETARNHSDVLEDITQEWSKTHLRAHSVVFPKLLDIKGYAPHILRYGENPHQSACAYISDESANGILSAKQIQGKELSFNNINDSDAALSLISEFNNIEEHAVAIIKHANPCGVAVSDNITKSYLKAWSCDPVSAFGGIVALNQTINDAVAKEIAKTFTEVIIAPGIEDGAREILKSKTNIRILIVDKIPKSASAGLDVRSIIGGYLVQSPDDALIDKSKLRVVTKIKPTDQDMSNMLFADKVAKHVKSNAIVYVKDGATVGIGAGQMNRVDSARIGAAKAEDARKNAKIRTRLTKNSVVASDAFFPFADGLQAAIDAGAKAVIQPGGSMRDDEVIAAADEAGIAMVFTRMRHFRH